jgi:transmembrane sensor
MKNDIQWELIIEYLEGLATKEDEEILNKWIQSNVENKLTFDFIKRIWSTPGNNLPKPDAEEAWKKVKDRISSEISSEDFPYGKIIRFYRKERKNSSWQHIFGSKLLKIAAVVIPMIIASYYVFTKPQSMREIIVERAQKADVDLIDGTKVTLDAGSIFHYPEDFGSEKREVFLDGEGYFEVAHNPDMPFIVHAHNSVVKVLGTKFDIRAWHQNKEVLVAVADGKVSLRSKEDPNPEEEVVITKGQVSEIKEKGAPSKPRDADIDDYLSWLNRKIYLQNVPLRQVFDQLERWYDIEISIADESYATKRITIFIDNKPIEETLDVIALMNNFKYKRNGRTIIFTPNEVKPVAEKEAQ